MGRTVETFSMVIQEQRALWAKFRGALRKEDQQVLDELFRAPKIHLAACAYNVKPIPFENVVMSMLIEERKNHIALQKEMNILKEQIAELRAENAKTRMVV